MATSREEKLEEVDENIDGQVELGDEEDYLRRSFFRYYKTQRDKTTQQEYSDVDFLMLFNGKQNNVHTADTAARQLGCSESTTWRRLNELVDRGLLHKEKLSRHCVFMLKHSVQQPWSSRTIQYLSDKANGRVRE